MASIILEVNLNGFRNVFINFLDLMSYFYYYIKLVSLMSWIVCQYHFLKHLFK